MFRLVLKKQLPTFSEVFETDRCTIGTEGEFAPLFTPYEYPLRKKHILIERRGIFIWVENLAHDPKTLLNGTPFWRKKVQSGDILQVGPLEWTIEDLLETKKIEEDDEDIAYSVSSDKPSFLKAEKNIPVEKKKSYISSLLNLLVLSACILFASVIVGTLTYLAISEKSLNHEKKAALGISDVAMALTYAKNKGIPLDQGNLLEPDNINNLIKQVVPEGKADILLSQEGSFEKIPYFLRIYFDAQFKRFLIIAQPSARLIQTLIPRPALLIDSNSMQLHKVSDLRHLNRLLVNANTLSEIEDDLFESLVLQSPVVNTTFLANSLPNHGFNLPPEIAFIPGASPYRVDLLPRYYSIQRSLESTDTSSMLPPHIVYVEGGIDVALRERKKLLEKNRNSTPPWIGYFNSSDFSDPHLLILSSIKTDDIALTDFEDETFESKGEQKETLFEEMLNIKENNTLLIKKDEETPLGLYLSFGDDSTSKRDLLFIVHNYFSALERKIIERQSALDEALFNLYNEWVIQKKTLSPQEFFETLDNSSLEVGLVSFNEISFEEGIKKIQEADSIVEIDATLVALLNYNTNKDSVPQETILKKIRPLVIQKLELFMWCGNQDPQEDLNDEALLNQERENFKKSAALWYLLKRIGLEDSDTLEIYMNEMAKCCCS